jgi:hypothetical protein
MLTTSVAGANPTWRQTKSKNDDIELEKAHMLQAFAFSDGSKRSAIVFNLSRNTALPVAFSGSSAPSGQVEISQLTSKNITDSNEIKENVVTTKTTMTGFTGSTPYQLPPYSMTVFKWTTAN